MQYGKNIVLKVMKGGKEFRKKTIHVKVGKELVVQKKKNQLSCKNWFEYWLDVLVKPTVKASTYSRYYSLMEKHLIPQFGDISLHQVTNIEVQRYFSSLSQQAITPSLSPSTIKMLYQVLKASFTEAYSHGLTPYQIQNIRIPRTNKPEASVLSFEIQKELESVVLSSDDPSLIGVLICLYTGIRIGELCALEWRHIDFERKNMHICQTTQRIQTVHDDKKKTAVIIGPPKSFTSIRDIPLPNFLINLLIPHYNAQTEHTFVLTTKNGTPYEPRAYQYKFHRLLKDTNIPYVNFHTLRHSFATRCIESGFDIKTLSTILGHANPSITMNHYIHSLEEQKKKAMNSLELVFNM